jgi:hypothetical protein
MSASQTEKALVRRIRNEIEEGKKRNAYSGLKTSYSHVNLARKSYEEIWQKWWPKKLPPRTEVDLILAYEDHKKLIDDAFLQAFEFKHFTKEDPGNFYYGLDQILAFGIFGFDGLVLWHLFEDVDQEIAQSFATTMKEIIEGLSLPVVYFASDVTKDLRFKCWEPARGLQGDLVYMISWIRNFFDQDVTRRYRNPLLFTDKLPAHRANLSEEIRRRRRTLKTMLKIP